MNTWNDIEFEGPPENRDVLCYTENGTQRVVRFYHGKPNTFLKILAWQELPEKPDWIKPTEEPEKIKQRGRKKK